MHLTLPAILSLATLPLTLALALPNSTNATNTTITPPSRYYLKTRVLDNGSADKNGLYVSSYHTGPDPHIFSVSPLQSHTPTPCS